MGIDAMPDSGSASQLGSEYAGNGELCWVAVITSTKTGSCGSPGGTSTDYESESYNNSGDMTGTSATGYGSAEAITWNVDSNEPMCINPSGTTCTGPSSTEPLAGSYTYNALGLRETATYWNASLGSSQTTQYSWDSARSSLLSGGTMNYIYGAGSAVPIAQIDDVDSYTSDLLSDTAGNVRAVVEVTPTDPHAYQLTNYTDYDTYGNPINESGSPGGGLTSEGITGDADSMTMSVLAPVSLILRVSSICSIVTLIQASETSSARTHSGPRRVRAHMRTRTTVLRATWTRPGTTTTTSLTRWHPSAGMNRQLEASPKTTPCRSSKTIGQLPSHFR